MNLLAIRMLLGDRAKYLGIVLGVTLAALLMSHQVTIFVGLMSRTRSFFQVLPGADLIVADPSTEFVEDVKAIPDTAVERLRGIPGVEWAVPLVRAPIKARLAGGRFRTCLVIGLDDATLIGGPAKMREGSVADLRRPDAIIVDRLDAEKLLSIQDADGSTRPPRVGDTLELNDHTARIVGISDNPRPFISQPIIYTTLSRAREFAPPERRTVSFALVKLASGADSADVARRVHAATGLVALDRRSFGWKTIGYYLRNTGIPINFGVTVLLGCVVGIAISGQTFYLFTLDNLKNLAALKAMGAPTSTLVRMVLLQASVVGVQGYALGVGFTAAFFAAFIGTDLEFQVHWEVLALTGAAILVVIVLATAASLAKVLSVEPATVFKA
jgi:putative ABC transport system permease protein